MNKFKEFYYWTDAWPDLPSVLLHLVRMGYTVAPFNRVLASGFPSAIFVATASGEVRFVWDKQAEVTSGLDKLSKSEILALTASDVTTHTQEKDPRDARVDELESALEQERHRRVVSENTRDFLQRRLQDVTSRSRKLKDDKSELTANRDELVKKLNDVGEHVSELNERLHFRDQVIDSQKRKIREWHQAYTRVSKELEALQNENSELRGRLQSSYDAAEARNVLISHQEAQLDVAAGKLVKLQSENDDLRKWGQEAHRNHPAVCKLKDIRIAGLEHELNTCKANYMRLLWMED